ncbi:hypothetical protein PRECH8_24520 [Insulibacter thermoxylanivorax]|uniref:Uncharacterized protein n=2 Tax=Insulibacter thermoxylanivorax TaxID=2749268 RepID=A0A916VH25_9BACL|nr:hypothetical protein PRECH8_24520 [Insulibacter thermoxylanivorax]
MIFSVSNQPMPYSRLMTSREQQQEKVEVDASYTPAEIEIHKRNPDMEADWDSVREEIGYLGPDAQIKELQARAQQKLAEGIAARVQAGKRARDIHKEPGNIFGKLAFERYQAYRRADIQLDAAPKFGVQIDVRIYPPEIEVETNVLKLKGADSP